MPDSARTWVHYCFVFFAVFLFSLSFKSVNCAAQEKLRHDAAKPVKVVSDSLEADDKKGLFTFIGHVVAQQDGATIYADQLDVFYSAAPQRTDKEDAGETPPRSIDKIIARGAVKIVQQDRIARGERAEYDYSTRAVVLTGSPSVVQGGNSVAGERITVFLGDERSIVEGGNSERVEAVFIPGRTQ